MTAPDAPRALSIPEAVAKLGVHRVTLWRMQRDGQITTIEIRGRRLVPVSEIERLLAGEPARSPSHAALGRPAVPAAGRFHFTGCTSRAA